MAGVVWLGLRHGTIPIGLFVDLDQIAPDLGLGAAAGGLLLGMWALARRLLPLARELEALLGQVLETLSRQEALALAVLSGFAEELFFRGAVQGALGRLGWLWAAALFSLLHSGPGRPFRLWGGFAFLAGLVFGGLVAWRGNLLPAIVGHGLVNAVSLGRLAGRRSEPAGT